MKKLSAASPAFDPAALLAELRQLNSTLDTRLKFLGLELSAARSDLIYTLQTHLSATARYQPAPDLSALSESVWKCLNHTEQSTAQLALTLSRLIPATSLPSPCSPCNCSDPGPVGLVPPDSPELLENGTDWATRNDTILETDGDDDSLCYFSSLGGHDLSVCVNTTGGLPHDLTMLFYYGELLFFHHYLFLPSGREKNDVMKYFRISFYLYLQAD